MDYYANADVVKTGDIEAIGTWLVEQEHVRDNDFDCIMIAGPDGHTYNDIGTKTQIIVGRFAATLKSFTS